MIWATVIFGPLRITQQWKLLRDEIGHDSEKHDFIELLITHDKKQVVIMLDSKAINAEGPVPCYLGELHAGHAGLLP
jgi:hypothetical protein